MKKENINIPSSFFIAFSVLAFFLVSTLYLFLSANTKLGQVDKIYYDAENDYLNNYNHDDPFMTKAGGFKNKITGPIVSSMDPYIGKLDAPVKIIVFADFSCRYCMEQEKVIEGVLKKYEDKVRFIWKDYPETNIESISFKSSLAARCAQNQNKFWEFHDGLFSRSIFSEADIFKIADELKINNKEFKKCYEEKETLPLILSNIEEANAIGIVGVPNVFINDKEFIGSVSESDFSLVIDNELKNE